jgi:DNA primase
MIDFPSIRTAHSLAGFCESRGLTLRGSTGGRLVTLCPLHREKSPSFTLYPDDYFYCYGCGAHGDVVDLCAALEGLTVKEAAEKLSAGDGMVSVPRSQPAIRTIPEPYRLSKEEISRMAAAAHKLAADNRKIQSLCKARPEWTYEALWHTALEGDLGIEGNRVLFGYRHGLKARWKDEAGERVFRWICGGAYGELWRQSSLRKGHTRIFITEGESDCLTGISIGLEEDGRSVVLALAGANVLPKPEPFRGREIIIIPDPDEQGRDSANKLRALLDPVARRVVTVNLEKLYRG